jgi:hypothetical protein
MSDKPRRSAWSYVALILAICLIYVLGAGPALRYRVTATGDGPRMLRAMYRPLGLAAQFPVIGEPCTQYLELWLPAGYEVLYHDHTMLIKYERP